jgi:hypothetical protein
LQDLTYDQITETKNVVTKDLKYYSNRHWGASIKNQNTAEKSCGYDNNDKKKLLNSKETSGNTLNVGSIGDLQSYHLI